MSLLVLAILTLRSLLLPPAFDCAQRFLRVAFLSSQGPYTRTRRCYWAHHDGLRRWSLSGALLISRGVLIHWIEDLHSKLVQSLGLRPIETCDAGLQLACSSCIYHASIDERWMSHAVLLAGVGKGLRISIHAEAASLSKYPDLSVLSCHSLLFSSSESYACAS